MDFSDKTLLVISDYPNQSGEYYGGIFVKEQVDELKKYFGHIYVISPKPVYKKNFVNYS